MPFIKSRHSQVGRLLKSTLISLHLSLTNHLPMLLLQSDVQSNQCTLYDHVLHKDAEQWVSTVTFVRKKFIAIVNEIFIPLPIVGNNYLFHEQVKSGVKLFRLAFLLCLGFYPGRQG